MKILDCTLRDGGYYTDWDFSPELVDVYLSSMSRLPVDYVEIGYRSLPKRGYFGRYFYSPEYVLEDAKRRLAGKKLAVLLDEKDVPVEKVARVLEPCRGLVDLVRIAVAPARLEEGVGLARWAKSAGFETALNVMYMSRWASDPTFFERLHGLSGAVDFLYMVDSFGSVFPEDVEELATKIRARTDVKLGFHGHNNLEMALANTRRAIASDFAIVDATVSGMGRGAGNLRMELLLTQLASEGGMDLDFQALTAVVEELERLRARYRWGTSIPYMISGANSLPQKQVMEWMTMRRYSIPAIVHMVQQGSGKQEAEACPAVTPTKPQRTLLIGGGASVAELAADLCRYVTDDTVLIHAGARHLPLFAGVKCPQYVCFRGVEANRFLAVVPPAERERYTIVVSSEGQEVETIIPSSLRAKVRSLSRVEFIEGNHEAPLAQAVQCALDLGASEVHLAGFDGYPGDVPDTFELRTETQRILHAACALPFADVMFVTPSLYEGPRADSLFNMLAHEQEKNRPAPVNSEA